MTQLIDLPPEILALISNTVHPTDLDNYVLACKSCRSTAASALDRHRKLQKQYGHVGYYSEGAPWTWPPTLLKTVMTEPNISCYVRRLSLENLGQSWSSRCGLDASPAGFETFDKFACYSHLKPSFITIASKDLNGPSNWERDFQDGSGEIIAAILISQLTHLSRLELGPSVVHSDGYLLRMLRGMTGMKHPKKAGHRDQQIESCDWSRRPQCLNEVLLSRLTTVQMGEYSIDLGFSDLTVDLLLFFMALPSVKTISVTKPDAWRVPTDAVEPLQSSNVSTLILVDGYLSSAFLQFLLGNIRSLEVFTHRCPQEDTIPFLAIQEALSTHALHTLRTLTLLKGEPDSEVWKEGTWSQFPNLVNLNIEINAFLPHWEDETDEDQLSTDSPEVIATLKKKLPPSLEHLRLFVDNDILSLPTEELGRIKKIVEMKEDVFPNLTRLDIYFDMQRPTTRDRRARTSLLMDQLLSSCRANKLELSVSFLPWGALPMEVI